MELTTEQIEELFSAEQPDVKICVHEFRIVPMKRNTEGVEYGFIARMLAHDADGTVQTIDFVTTEPVLRDIIESCMEAGIVATVSKAIATGDTDEIVALLQNMTSEL